jgi:putative transcriptional regulator
VALYQGFEVLGYAGQNKIFSQAAVKALRTIKFCHRGGDVRAGVTERRGSEIRERLDGVTALRQAQDRANMAIIINIDVMLARRKMSVTELAEKVGITMANISILKNGKAKAIRLSTMDAVCKALDCQPGDILEFRKEG